MRIRHGKTDDEFSDSLHPMPMPMLQQLKFLEENIAPYQGDKNWRGDRDLPEGEFLGNMRCGYPAVANDQFMQ